MPRHVLLLCVGCLAVVGACRDPQPAPAPLPASAPAIAWPTVADAVLHPAVDPAEQAVTDPAERARRGLPVRVISLAPNLTETVHALGLGAVLVGRDQFSAYPPAVLGLPDCGGLLNRNVEQIVQLRPDLVLVVKTDAELPGKLAQHGIATRVLPDGSLADVYTTLREVGAALGRPRTATALAERLQADIQAVSAVARAHLPAGLRVALPGEGFMPPPAQNYFAGPASWTGQLVLGLGAVPAVSNPDQTWVRMSLEQIVAVNPQVIVEIRPTATLTPELLRKAREAWQLVGGVDAVRNGRIVLLCDPVVVVPGPRINLAALELAKAITAAAPAP